MITFENQILVERPVDEVFSFVSDFQNVPKWNYYVKRVERISGRREGIGTTYHQVRKTDEQRFRVIGYRPPERVTVKTEPGSQPAFEMAFRFEPVDGGTRITDTWQLDTGRPVLLEKLAAGQIKRAVMDNLTKLKTLLETGRVQLQDGRVIRR